MKKIFLLLMLWVSNAFAQNSVIKIYNNNPERSLFINYQICAAEDFGHTRPIDECKPSIQNINLSRNQDYNEVAVEDEIFYLRIINAYQFDEEGVFSGYGEFFGEKMCMAFSNKPVMIGEEQKNNKKRHIICKFPEEKRLV